MNLTDVMVARDEQWTRATTADERAAIRAEYVAAGWTICKHESCPPFDCRGQAGSAALYLLLAFVPVVMVVWFVALLAGSVAGGVAS